MNGNQYIGNNDFRGYLNYLAQNGDSSARNALQYTGNDGGVNMGVLREMNQGVMGGIGEDQRLQDAAKQYVDNAYTTWLGKNNSGASNTFLGSGSGGSTPTFDQAAFNASQGSLDALGGILNEALANADRGYRNSKSAFDAQEALERKNYDEDTTSNMSNYDANLMASIRAGSSGLQGLQAALRGGGASGNQFAQNWAKDTVGNTTANDIREGYNTFDENRRERDSSLSNFLTQLQGKRRENEDTLENNRRAAYQENAENSQRITQDMARLLGDANRSAERDEYTRRAAAYTPTIASNSNAMVREYNQTPVQVESADITAFSAPEKQNMTATDNRSAQGIFSMNDPRRRRTAEAEV